ncbi:hypothetical protein PAPYR_318 [Paratrimastix pyriformis]|uniref:N-acetyltransferase domain-containing protein n=1 Tax=Paratrimastix pyriformis TaxID=342808 RepID=A0ABQ8V1W5_9EUKA|nr:hypothetical protein PAPYR_318 [Paratrimastix pyriformis]
MSGGIHVYPIAPDLTQEAMRCLSRCFLENYPPGDAVHITREEREKYTQIQAPCFTSGVSLLAIDSENRVCGVALIADATSTLDQAAVAELNSVGFGILDEVCSECQQIYLGTLKHCSEIGSPIPGGKVAEILNLGVLPTHRGRRIAAKLIEEAEQRLALLGYRRLYSTTVTNFSYRRRCAVDYLDWRPTAHPLAPLPDGSSAPPPFREIALTTPHKEAVLMEKILR